MRFSLVVNLQVVWGWGWGFKGGVRVRTLERGGELVQESGGCEMLTANDACVHACDGAARVARAYLGKAIVIFAAAPPEHIL